MSSELKKLENWQVHFFSFLLDCEKDIVNDISPIGDLTPQACLNIYKRGYRARLVESLGETFEATWWVLGDELFMRLANEYVIATPSADFDLSSYGNSFHGFLSQQEVRSELPFVPELSLFEWLFKDIFHSREMVTDNKQIIEALKQNPNAHIGIHSSARIWTSPFAIYEIWKNRSGDISSVSSHNWDTPESLLLYKSNGKVFIKSLDRFELFLLTEFAKPNGQSLELAVESYISLNALFEPNAIERFFSSVGSTGVLKII